MFPCKMKNIIAYNLHEVQTRRAYFLTVALSKLISVVLVSQTS